MEKELRIDMDNLELIYTLLAYANVRKDSKANLKINGNSLIIEYRKNTKGNGIESTNDGDTKTYYDDITSVEYDDKRGRILVRESIIEGTSNYVESKDGFPVRVEKLTEHITCKEYGIININNQKHLDYKERRIIKNHISDCSIYDCGRPNERTSIIEDKEDSKLIQVSNDYNLLDGPININVDKDYKVLKKM